MKFDCAHCGRTADRPAGQVNRSRGQGLQLYCGRKCSGLDHRKPQKPKAQRKFEKRLYDQEYRRQNLATIKAKKRARHFATYDPEKERVKRKARMPQHVEYCRRPEYRRWKSAYDKRHRAKKFYGAFAEAAMLTTELNREIKGRMTNEQIKWENGTANKRQFRHRATSGEKQKGRPRHRQRRGSDPATLG